jgi:hypothetical protein
VVRRRGTRNIGLRRLRGLKPFRTQGPMGSRRLRHYAEPGEPPRPCTPLARPMAARANACVVVWAMCSGCAKLVGIRACASRGRISTRQAVITRRPASIGQATIPSQGLAQASNRGPGQGIRPSELGVSLPVCIIIGTRKLRRIRRAGATLNRTRLPVDLSMPRLLIGPPGGRSSQETSAPWTFAIRDRLRRACTRASQGKPISRAASHTAARARRDSRLHRSNAKPTELSEI